MTGGRLSTRAGVGLALAALALALATPNARAAGPGTAAWPIQGAPPSSAATGKQTGAPKKKRPKVRKPAQVKTKRRAARASGGGPGRDPRRIAEGAPRITAFPSDGGAVDRAFAENRRDQITEAERTARAASQDDRWHNVLFHIRELDSRADPEACFWRVLAFYRLGQIGRARTMRLTCELPNPDGDALEKEDVLASGMQPAQALPELRVAGELDSDGIASPNIKPVVNAGPYLGAAPPHIH